MSRSFTVYIASSVCFLALLISCTDEPTAPPPPGSGDTLAVTVVAEGGTSITLRLHVNSAGEYRLDRDGTTAWSGSITPPDTVITDTGLLPSTEYHYTLSHIIDGGIVSSSPMTTARTGDTVSHEFVWEVDTLFYNGTTTPAFITAEAMYGASATNVYMAGYSTDSKHKAWHWNGEKWSTVALAPYVSGSVIDIDGIDSSFIVFAGEGPGVRGYTGLMALRNGNFEQLPLANGKGQRTCIHVVSPHEIYLGGKDGVQRYNGTEWEWLLDSTETTGNEFLPQYIYKFPDGMLEMVSQRDDASRGTNVVRWKWENNLFVAVDSFDLDRPEYDQIRFGYSIHESNQEIFSISIGGTFVRRGDAWEKIRSEGGIYISGNMNDLVIGGRWTYFWHYNGHTIKNLWSQLLNLVPDINIIHAVYYIDGVLFISAELEGTRNVVMIRGRHRGG